MDPIKAIDSEEVADFGAGNLQLLLNAGLNIFAIELLAESYVRSELPGLKRPTRLTMPVRERSGMPKRRAVRITLETVED